MTIKTKKEIDLLREGGKLLASVLEEVSRAVKPGVSTLALDQLGERLIRGAGGIPSFKGYRVRGANIGFPGSLCISVNDEIVHGLPRKDSILEEGDIVGLDIGMWWPVDSAMNRPQLAVGRPKGALCTDMAVTIGVGKISKEAERLLQATKESLDIGITKVRAGVHVGDIGFSIEERLKGDNLGIIRDLAGHGVGYEVHEDPLIPNFGEKGTGPVLTENMVIAIEPMATLGDWRVVLDHDQWTFKTLDGSLGAHFEHTMAVTKDGVEVLTI